MALAELVLSLGWQATAFERCLSDTVCRKSKIGKFTLRRLPGYWYRSHTVGKLSRRLLGKQPSAHNLILIFKWSSEFHPLSLQMRYARFSRCLPRVHERDMWNSCLWFRKEKVKCKHHRSHGWISRQWYEFGHFRVISCVPPLLAVSMTTAFLA